MKNRNKLLILNTLSSLTGEIVAAVCGFILPKFMLSAYGSGVNGLVSSITQYLGFIALLEMGVGTVVQTAYYKPLSENDSYKVSLIYKDSRNFFSFVGYILIGYVVCVCILFTRVVSNPFDDTYTISLILCIAASLFMQYYFCAPMSLLVNAAQQSFITGIIRICFTILNTATGVFLITFGASIQLVKAAAALLYMFQPIALKFYIDKHFKIIRNAKDPRFKIEQKWNGFAQHCATVVMNNTDIMILSVMTDFRVVSVYTVYYLVLNGMKTLFTAISNGCFAFFGDLYARREMDELNRRFNLFEWILNESVVFAFGITSILIVPFVMNYTRGIEDAQYDQMAFALIFTLSQAVYCIRLPYHIIICSAGHFKQTQTSAIIEMVLNILISFVSVKTLGLIGIAIGTFAAIAYRTIYFLTYLHREILFRGYRYFVRIEILNMIQVAVIWMIKSLLDPFMNPYASVISWVSYAIVISILSFVTIFIICYLFWRKNLMQVISIVHNNSLKYKSRRL